jgi:hypothetical protein
MHNLINLVKFAVLDTIRVITAITSPGKTFYNHFPYQV